MRANATGARESRRHLALGGAVTAVVVGVGALVWLALADRAAPAFAQPTSPSTSHASVPAPLQAPAPAAAVAPKRRPLAAAEIAAPIVGVVLDPTGCPRANAVVVALPLVAGHPRLQAVTHTESGEDGRFSLPAPVGLEHDQEIALVASCAGLRPATVRVPWRGSDEHERTLQLETGGAIEGRVEANGRGVAAVVLVAPPESAAPAIPVPRHGHVGNTLERPLLWIDGRAEAWPEQIATAEDGSFRLGGLGPQALTLYATQLGDHADGVGVEHRRSGVTPPAAGVVIDLTGSEIEVRGWPREVAADAQVRVHVGAGSSTEPLSRGAAVFEVPPNARVTVELIHPRRPTATRTVVAPPIGQRIVVDIALGSMERASLDVVLHDAAALEVNAITVTLSPTESGNAALLAAERAPGTDCFHCGVVPLDAGPYRVDVGPARRGTQRGDLLLPIAGAIDLPASGSVAIELSASLGGRVQPVIETPGGADYEAHLRLCDAEGRPLLQATELRKMHEQTAVKLLARWESAAGAGARPFGIVEPGRYRLQASAAGYEPVAEDVEVVAGRISSAHLLLKRPPERH